MNKTKFRWLNKYTQDSAVIYMRAFIEACIDKKVTDYARALTDTDDFPRLRNVTELEFAIGWLHGCAECHGVPVTELLKQITVREVCSVTKKGRAA